MEEEKAAAYYDELTRKGEAAARFKQGLGFSSSSRNDDVPARGSALSSSSSLSGFVRASSPSTCHKKAQIESIQNKLKLKKTQSSPPRVREMDRDRASHKQEQFDSIQNKLKQKKTQSSPPRGRERDRDSDRDRYRDRDSHKQEEIDSIQNKLEQKKTQSSPPRVRERDRDRYRDKDSEHQKRHQSSSRDIYRYRDRDRDRERRSRRRSRSRSVSPEKRKREGNGGVDYTKLIDGYEKMTPAERVRAKMKFQLSETAEKDAKNGMGSGWERFEFDKDAPLDDEEMEVADDDVALVKHIGQSFRFSTVEAKREDQIKAAHDEAIFGSSRVLPSIHTEHRLEMKSEGESDSQKKKQGECSYNKSPK